MPALRDDSDDAADGPVPAASANGPGQLPWPARGPLAGDQDVLRVALRAWQAGVPERQRPERAATLWAGDLDGLRTVLLQGTDRSGQSWVADVVGIGDTPTLRATEPLGRAVPLLSLGTSAGAVRLLPPPDAESGGVLAAVGAQMRPLAVAGDGLTQGVTAPPDGLRVALTDAGAVVGSGTMLPGRISPTSGSVELTRSVLDLGPAQPPAPVWYDDGELVARRLGGSVGVVQVGPTRSTAIRVGGRRTRLEARGYEAVRAGTRHLATVVRVGGAPACTDTATVGPADATPGRPVLLVARCIPRGADAGVLTAVATGGVRSVRVTVAPATPGRPARAARVVTIGGVSGTGLVGLSGVPDLPTSAAPAVALGAGNRAVARMTLPPYRGPHP